MTKRPCRITMMLDPVWKDLLFRVRKKLSCILGFCSWSMLAFDVIIKGLTRNTTSNSNPRNSPMMHFWFQCPVLVNNSLELLFIPLFLTVDIQLDWLGSLWTEPNLLVSPSAFVYSFYTVFHCHFTHSERTLLKLCQILLVIFSRFLITQIYICTKLEEGLCSVSAVVMVNTPSGWKSGLIP